MGLLSTSLHIFLVGQYLISTSPFLILSLTKKYRALMCLVLFDDENLPFTARLIVDRLSSKIIFCLMEYPWASIK